MWRQEAQNSTVLPEVNLLKRNRNSYTAEIFRIFAMIFASPRHLMGVVPSSELTVSDANVMDLYTTPGCEAPLP